MDTHLEAPAHSPLGPSSAERWINCPGSVALTRDLPDVDTEFSLEGTAAHSVLEIMRSGKPAPRFVDVPQVKSIPRMWLVTPEMVAACQYFIDHMAELPGFEFNEVRVDYEMTVEGGFGTLDGAKASHNTLYIRDFKYGKGVIKYAERNPQLMLYAIGFLETYGYLFPDLVKFNLGIVQPRSDHVDVWECDLEELRRFIEEDVRPAINKIERAQPSAVNDVHPGEWCQFCKLRDTCRVRAQAAVTDVIGEFSNIVGLTEVKQPTVTLTPDERAAALKAAPLLEAWIKDLRKGAMESIGRGEAVGDWKIVEGRSNRGWSNDATAGERLQAAGMDPWEKKLISVAKAEDEMGKKVFAAKLGDLVHKPRGNPTLAPGSDRRPPISADIIKEFEVTGD